MTELTNNPSAEVKPDAAGYYARPLCPFCSAPWTDDLTFSPALKDQDSRASLLRFPASTKTATARLSGQWAYVLSTGNGRLPSGQYVPGGILIAVVVTPAIGTGPFLNGEVSAMSGRAALATCLRGGVKAVNLNQRSSVPQRCCLLSGFRVSHIAASTEDMAQHMAIPKKYTVSISVPQAARLLSLHEATLRYRMSKDGLTLEQAIALGPSKRPRIRVGQKFGHLTVAQVLPSVQGGNARVLAKCSCGAIKECLAMALKNGHVVRCGQCDLGRELHGKSNSASYGSWSSMRQRCSNPNRPDYPSYGGRGISVCPEWSKSFTAFLRDMGERPDGTTLERNDVNGNYEPDNCRWATYSDQSSNRRPYKHKAKYSRRSAGELPQS